MLPGAIFNSYYLFWVFGGQNLYSASYFLLSFVTMCCPQLSSRAGNAILGALLEPVYDAP